MNITQAILKSEIGRVMVEDPIGFLLAVIGGVVLFVLIGAIFGGRKP
jgi:hypothetical protein